MKNGFLVLFEDIEPRTKREEKLITFSIYSLLRHILQMQPKECLRFGCVEVMKISDDALCVKSAFDLDGLIDELLDGLEESGIIRRKYD